MPRTILQMDAYGIYDVHAATDTFLFLLEALYLITTEECTHSFTNSNLLSSVNSPGLFPFHHLQLMSSQLRKGLLVSEL